MKVAIATVALFLSIGAACAAESTGERIKSDAKGVAHGVKDAAVDVGKQIGQGSKKAYKSTKNKIKGDVKSGKPGDGSYAKKNEKMNTAKDGRE
jgi:outer membrane lipoprotein-sorting protein